MVPVAMAAEQHKDSSIYSDDNEAIENLDGKGAQSILTWDSSHDFPMPSPSYK